MKLREFNKTINSCRTKKGKQLFLDKAKLQLLSDEVKHSMALFVIRNRKPLITDLITPLMDISWLDCMGYMYTSKGKDFTFRHISGSVVS